jgi:myo-inositol-1(or 4)-monophosphatase
MTDFLTELRCAESLARAAGRRIARQRRDGFTVELKSENDPVTSIDISTEEFIHDELRGMFPDDVIIGEELGEDLGSGEAPERAWVVDPIDGTLNFSRDLPMFCTSIAFQIEGRSVAGAIYDPRRDELFSARRGGGAYLNEKPMEVSDVDALGQSLLVTGFPRSMDGVEEDNLVNFAKLTRASRGVRRLGSAALDLAYVACGRLDGFWEYYLHPWDTAAGYLLVQEAGGRVTDTAGGVYTADDSSVLATNGQIHDEVVERLSKI